MNYYLYLWIIITPIIIYVFYKSDKKCINIIGLITAVLICWFFMFLSVRLHYKIQIDKAVSQDELLKLTLGDGGPISFAYIFGWIPSTVYSIFWIIIYKIIKR